MIRGVHLCYKHQGTETAFTRTWLRWRRVDETVPNLLDLDANDASLCMSPLPKLEVMNPTAIWRS